MMGTGGVGVPGGYLEHPCCSCSSTAPAGLFSAGGAASYCSHKYLGSLRRSETNPVCRNGFEWQTTRMPEAQALAVDQQQPQIYQSGSLLRSLHGEPSRYAAIGR